MKLKNKTLGNVLKAFLIVGIIFNGLLVITTFFYSFKYEVFERIILFDQIFSMFSGIALLLSIIFYLIWIAIVHGDLRKLDPYYPIKPVGALLRILVPIYNIYGLWNIYSTMSNYFNQFPDLQKKGDSLYRLIPYYYLLYIVSNIFNELVSNRLAGDTLIFISYVCDFVVMITFVLITKTILSAFHIIETDIDNYMEEERQPQTPVYVDSQG